MFEKVVQPDSQMLGYEELAQLPEGVFLGEAGDANSSKTQVGLALMAAIRTAVSDAPSERVLSEIAKRGSLAKPDLTNFELRQVAGTVALMPPEVSGIIFQKLLTSYPHLKFFRGGTANAKNDTYGTSYFAMDGAMGNGFLGSFLEPLNNYLHQDTDLNQRVQPVLYVVGLDGIVEGLRTRAIRLTSEHREDVGIIEGMESKYPDWCRKYVRIYQVPKEKVMEAEAVLATKTV